jgi:hypothetical protein
MSKQIEVTTTPKTPKTSKATCHILNDDGSMSKVAPQAGKKRDARTKITGAQIDFIRRNALQLGGTMGQPALAAKVGCSQPTVSYIIHGKIRVS